MNNEGEGAVWGKREMNEASKKDYNTKGEDHRQTGQEEVNKGREVAADRVR